MAVGESSGESSSAFKIDAGSTVQNITVGGDVAGRDIVKITEELTYDVSDLSENPYLGLASYTYATRAFYGGREEQVREVTERMTAPGAEPVLLFVTGASGSGKSSFAQAGLLPALEQAYLARGRTVRWSVMRPGRNPVAALAQALSDIGVPQPATGDLRDNLRAPEDLSTLLTLGIPRGQIRVLIVDQFEELFTQAEPAERDRMCALLAGIGAFARVQTHIVATMRADYLPTLFDVPRLFDRIKRDGVELRAMQAEELARAIARPIQEQARREQKDKRIDPALLERLVEDVQGDPTLLPLLQVTLRALWDRPPHKMVLGRYHSLTDALEEHAEDVYACDRQGRARSDVERNAIMDLFVELVKVSLDQDARRDARRTVPKSDLLHLHPEFPTLIDELVDARLLATSVHLAPGGTVDVVDLIHETLLTNWPRLRNEVASRREARQRGERFRIALQDWLEHDRSLDYLLQGVRLAEAQQLADSGDLGLRWPGAQDFLAQSIDAQEQAHRRELEQAQALAEEQRERAEVEHRARRRQTRFSIVIAVLAAVALIVAGVAVWLRAAAETERARSVSRELALQSIVELPTDPEQSLLLATEAALTGSTVEAEDALRQSLLQSHVRAVLSEPTGALSVATLSPDGAQVATGGEHGSVRIWDVANGTSLEFRGHTSAIAAVAFSRDQRHFATGSYDNTARIWDPSDPSRPVVLRGHTDAVVSLAFSPDDRRVLTASLDGTAAVWDSGTGDQQLDLRGHLAGLTTAVFDPTGDRIATGSYDQTIRLWNARTGALVATLEGQEGAVSSLAFTSDGQRLAAADYDGAVRVWDVAHTSDPLVLRGHTDGVAAVAFSPDNTHLLSASLDKTARVWDVRTGVPPVPPVVLSGHTGALSSAAFSPDGTRLLTGSADRTARVWDAGTGKQLAILRGHVGGVTSAAFSADGRDVLTVGDSTARVWEPTADQELLALTGFRQAVSALAFSPNGGRLLAASADGTAQVWNVATWTRTAAFAGHSDGIVSAAFNPAGDAAVTASLDGTAAIWDTDTGQELRILGGHSEPLTDAHFSPDGRRIVTGSRNGTVRLWDARSGAELQMIASTGIAVTAIAFDPLGAWLATSFADGTARVWDAQTGRELATLADHTGWITGLLVDAHSSARLITTSADATARLWDPLQGLQSVLQGHTGTVTSAALSPDGKALVTSSVDGTARVSSLSDAWAPVVLEGHRLPVWSAAFSPNGDSVLTAGDDGTARIWNATNGVELTVLRGHTGPVRAAVFSPNGRYIATAGRDGIIQIHLSRMADLVDLAIRRLPAARLEELRRSFPSASSTVVPQPELAASRSLRAVQASSNLETASTPGCSTAVYWAAVGATHPALGCPTFASSSDSTFQQFQAGLMIWRKNPSPSRILVLSTYPTGNRWEAYVDHSPDPEVRAVPDPGCPEYQRRGSTEPASGFDTLWCEPWNWKLQLGAPLADAQPGGPNLIQQFEHGSVFSLAAGPGLILYTDGSWETFIPS